MLKIPNKVALGELCSFQRGLTYSKPDEVDFSNNVVLRANNIDLESNELNFDDLKYINDSIQIPTSKRLVRNSLLICTASGSKKHLGKVAFIDDEYDYAFGGFMGMITPKPTVLPKFLFYSLISKDYKEFISKLSDGVNINNLKFNDLKLYELNVPSLEEQAKIVLMLDSVNEKIRELLSIHQRKLEVIDELKSSVFQKTLNGQIESVNL